MTARAVEWSREALDDIKARLLWIARDRPGAARRVAARIREAGDGLAEMATGRPGRVPGTYEKPVSGQPWVLAYTIGRKDGRETVFILRVIHTARDWPDDGWPR
ncbi:MAG: type II toxin-antitoxin system RelE/ParE family toxin [Pseudomonadota bacterium]|nr:type II toxin-antitoxin system RelE/ParE family toxin [Pseudomonadota bacterium]